MDTSGNNINYDTLQMINILRTDCLEMLMSERRIIDMIYSHLRNYCEMNVVDIIDNMIAYYEIENIGNFVEIEEYIQSLNISDDDTPEDDNTNVFDRIDDIILETGHGNIRFTRMIVNSSRFRRDRTLGTSPPSTSSSPLQRPRFEDVKVILQKKELDKHPLRKYKEVSKETRENNPSCTVCMEEFEEDSMVRKMVCKHVFHQECIDKWLLEYSYKCPMCRTECGKYQPRI